MNIKYVLLIRSSHIKFLMKNDLPTIYIIAKVWRAFKSVSQIFQHSHATRSSSVKFPNFPKKLHAMIRRQKRIFHHFVIVYENNFNFYISGRGFKGVVEHLFVALLKKLRRIEKDLYLNYFQMIFFFLSFVLY